MSDLTLYQALDVIDNLVLESETRTEVLPFDQAVGRILAEDLYWDRAHPPYNRAAMDGYAFPQNPVKGSKWVIVGTSRAGKRFEGEVKSGQCVKIATGALVPDACTTVVPWEKTAFSEKEVTINQEVKPGANIHLKGSDLQKGEMAVKKGTCLTEGHVALLSTIGAHKLRVQKPVRLALLSTGSELVAIDQKPGTEQVRASNFYTLKTLIARNRKVELVAAEFLEDDFEALERWFASVENAVDCFLVTGGVGTSDYDLVPELSEKRGFKTLLHGLAIKPGHPLFLSRKGDRVVLGLPGNPVSAVACYTMFATRLIRKLQKISNQPFASFEAGEDLVNGGKRLLMRPVRMNGKYVYPARWNGSGDVSALAHIDGFALIEPRSQINKGCLAECIAMGLE
ncbi:MAG: hypothetical protein CR997_10345 [Acidobacteria bacterium]|nr:MAG: hypothetical protein CR997_10345 [Acidobacteriota bacterium]